MSVRGLFFRWSWVSWVPPECGVQSLNLGSVRLNEVLRMMSLTGEARQFREVRKNISLWALLSRRYSLNCSAERSQVVDWACEALTAQRERPATELNWRRGVRWKESLDDGIPFMQEGLSMVGSRSLRLLASEYDPISFGSKINVYPKSEGYELQSVLQAQSATQALAKGTLRTAESLNPDCGGHQLLITFSLGWAEPSPSTALSKGRKKRG